MPVTTEPRRAHAWIAGAALLWNLIGLSAFVMQLLMTPEQVAALSPGDRAVHEATPSWLMVAFGLAVVAGVLGSVGLLLRRRWAVPCFAVSLAALVVQVAGAYLVTPLWQASGIGGAIMPAVLLVIAVLLLRYARRVTR